ncbi:ribonuclease HII [Eubacteriaceae bacterium ES3]|nr:ribonuclease HII [Eubacteriaceae bacterium ES3]
MDFKSYKVGEIKELIKNIPVEEYERVINALSADSRVSVNKLGLSLSKQKERLEIELNRIDKLKELETKLNAQGVTSIAGIDEVGRGPLAGPVVTCAIIMPAESRIMNVNDSKCLSKKRREELNKIIMDECLDFGIGIADPEVIDTVNILNATKTAMLLAVGNLSKKPELLLIDAVTLDTDIPQKGIIKGDSSVYVIACASIVAKVFRDKLMEEYHEKYPEYGFDKNMGYGTAQHIEAIRKYGLTPIHRESFVKNIV